MAGGLKDDTDFLNGLCLKKWKF